MGTNERVYPNRTCIFTGMSTFIPVVFMYLSMIQYIHPDMGTPNDYKKFNTSI